MNVYCLLLPQTGDWFSSMQCAARYFPVCFYNSTVPTTTIEGGDLKAHANDAGKQLGGLCKDHCQVVVQQDMYTELLI